MQLHNAWPESSSESEKSAIYPVIFNANSVGNCEYTFATTGHSFSPAAVGYSVTLAIIRKLWYGNIHSLSLSLCLWPYFNKWMDF